MQVADQLLLLFPSWSGPGPHHVLCKKGKPQEPAKFIPHSPLEEQEKDKLGPFIWAEHSYGHFDAAPRDQDLSFDAFLGDGASGRIHLEHSILRSACIVLCGVTHSGFPFSSPVALGMEKAFGSISGALLSLILLKLIKGFRNVKGSWRQYNQISKSS